MHRLGKPLLLIVVALLIPIVPFLVLGDGLSERIEEWLAGRPSRLAAAGAVAGVLVSDIFLPIPSSGVCTYAGAHLGKMLGTAAAWLGMTAGAVFGFGLARLLGRPLAERLAGRDELDRLDPLAERYGPAILVALRPLPVLAEASVLLFGATGLAWRRFLAPVAAANLGLAMAWAAFGDLASRYSLLPAALALSLALPVVALLLARRWLGKTRREVDP